jgi:hypothetical protein
MYGNRTSMLDDFEFQRKEDCSWEEEDLSTCIDYQRFMSRKVLTSNNNKRRKDPTDNVAFA